VEALALSQLAQVDHVLYFVPNTQKILISLRNLQSLKETTISEFLATNFFTAFSVLTKWPECGNLPPAK
jgi:hypothetical protein